MLAMNPRIVQALCESVRFSRHPKLANFFKSFCDNYKWWVKRFQHDFPGVYRTTAINFFANELFGGTDEDIYTTTATAVNVDVDSYVRDEESREMVLAPQSIRARKRLLSYWTFEYRVYYETLYDEYSEMIAINHLPEAEGIRVRLRKAEAKTEEEKQRIMEVALGTSIRRFLRLGMDPNMMISSRRVPLLNAEGITDPTIEIPVLNVAILYGNDRFVEALLDYGANPNLKDTYSRRGRTALHEAVQVLGSPLVTAGRELGVVNPARPMILDLVLQNERTNLDEKDGTGDKLSGAGDTALMVAAKIGYDSVVQKLLEAGADPAIQTWYHSTAADMARDKGYPSLARKIENFIATGLFADPTAGASGRIGRRAKGKSLLPKTKVSTRKVDKLQEWLE
jgi:hypothetical protein